MNKQNNGSSLSDTLLNSLAFWLTGGMLFWFTELLTLVIGLPFMWAFRRARSTGVSTSDTVASILSLNEIAAGFLAYISAGLVAGIICAALVQLFAGKRDGAEKSALLASVSLAFTFFLFSGFWVSVKYLPEILTLKSLLAGAILLAGSFGIAYVFFKGRVTGRHERLFAAFAASVFIMDVFLLGEILLLRIMNARLVSPKGFAATSIFIALCVALFFLLRRGLRSGRFDGPGPRSVRKWVFVLGGALAIFSGIAVIVTLPDKAGASGSRGAAGDMPNILFIVMDTTRADRLSCYGYKRKTSPYLDRIAAEGTLFKNAVSTTGWTLPSHVSMFTGLFPFEHGVGHVSPHLPEDIETLTGILKGKGYATLGYSNNPWVSFFTGLSRKFDDFQVGWKRSEHKFFYKSAYDRVIEFAGRNDPDRAVNDHGAARTTRYVSEWMEKNSGEPFYVFINYMEPHLPYDPPPPYNSLFMPDGVSSEEIRKFAPDTEDIRTLMVQRERGEKELSVINALYDGEINYLDGRIWKLYEKLKELGILDNTMIIITSDHGDNLGEHGILGHAYGLFNTLIDVPLIIRYPKYFVPGTTVGDNVQITDLFYTILDVAGAEQNPSGPGPAKSLLKRIREQDYQKTLIAEHDVPVNNLNWARKEGINVDHLDKEQRVIISGGYKYLQTSNGEEELYDLEKDYYELNNLIAESSGLASAMRDKFKETYGKALRKSTPGAGRRPELDEETKQRLKSLGYINR
ncbi:MAG: hypothetical protein C4526_10720 [Nitrospiraceae bacterium]|nr:MAG: hypothetical protein C4526_10720 [Nitrospiraceae bacterium]